MNGSTRKMAGLLVSVRDVAEAQDALVAGTAVIDVKEPNRGALGAADPDQWQAVAALAGPHVPVSVALGELLDVDIRQRVEQLPRIAFAKVGLAGCQNRDDWIEKLGDLFERFPAGVRPVAVVYADWKHAISPSPGETIRLAARLRCSAVLFDTFSKGQGWLLDHLATAELTRLCNEVRRVGMRAVVAGSVDLNRLPRVLECEPDLVAVRGAACGGCRTDRISRSRVRALVAGLGNSPSASLPAFSATYRVE